MAKKEARSFLIPVLALTSNSLISFHSNREPLWLLDITANNKMCLGLHVKYPTFLPHFNKINNSWMNLP